MSMFSRLMNSCKPEHELSNVQPQIRGISKSIDNYHKEVLNTVREIGRWQVHQEPPIQNYLSTMAQFEEEIASASVEYTDGYTKFAEFWEAVLEEHKSLQDTEKQHDKAVKQVEKHLGKKIKAETVDEPSETKIGDESAALSDAQAHEQELRSRLNTKMLAYEKNLHKNLRMAYYILHTARLDYYRKCEDISTRAIAAIDTLPDVGEIKQFEFVYQPFQEPISEMAKPYWGYERVKPTDLTGSLAASGGRAGQVGASAAPMPMDVNAPQFAAVSSAVPMGLAMSDVGQQQQPQFQQQQMQQPQVFQQPQVQQQPLFQPQVQQQAVSQTPEVGLFPLSTSEEIPSQQQSQPSFQQDLSQQQQPLLQQDISQQPSFQQDLSQLPLSQQPMLEQQQQQQQPLEAPIKDQGLQGSSDIGNVSNVSNTPSFWEGGQKPSDLSGTASSYGGGGSVMGGSSTLASSSDQPSNLSQQQQPLSNAYLDRPDIQSQNIGASDQFGSSTPSIERPLLNPDMGSSSTTNISSDIGRDTELGSSSGGVSDIGSSSIGQSGGATGSVDTSSVFKPSEISASQNLGSSSLEQGTSSPVFKQSTFLNPPSYMNPPSSSLNPDYSMKQQADVGTATAAGEAANRTTDVGIGSKGERIF